MAVATHCKLRKPGDSKVENNRLSGYTLACMKSLSCV